MGVGVGEIQDIDGAASEQVHGVAEPVRLKLGQAQHGEVVWSRGPCRKHTRIASHRSRLAVLLVEVDEWESMFPDLLGSSMMRRLLACFAFSCTQRLHYKAVSAWRSAPFKEGVHVWM